MGAHDLNNTLLKLAQDMGLLPTPSHRLGIQALREISKHANVPLQKVRRWNNQRNYRMTRGGINRPYFIDKEGRDFLSDVFAQDPRPSLEQMQALALALGVKQTYVCRFFRRRRYMAKQKAQGATADSFMVF